MTKKLIIVFTSIIILFFFFFILLSNHKTKNVDGKYEFNLNDLILVTPKLSKGTVLDHFNKITLNDLNLPNNTSMGDYCFDGDNVYVSVDFYGNFGEVKKTQVINYNLKNHQYNVLYETKEGLHGLAELSVSGNYLFWEEEGNYTRIIKYDLTKKQFEKIYEINFAPLLIEANNNLLTWFEPDKRNTSGLILKIYNFNDNTTEERNNIYIPHTYLRAIINEDYLTYLQKDAAGNIYLHSEGLGNKKDTLSIKIPEEFEPFSVEGNQQFVIFRGKYFNQELFILNKKNGKFYKIDFSKYVKNLFSYKIQGDRILLIDSTSHNAFIYNIKTNRLAKLLQMTSMDSKPFVLDKGHKGKFGIRYGDSILYIEK
ncbi:hypothetical protein [Carboxydothermus hydrogenoformans]|uniref:Uncharacterized protein n=1 Tax=Carboxydothermus hydrogenoformans (strain ATCC BAA-161 / DSM 6008 / Z-2901) TaxID=246194 RepID=Q3AAX2_CARHZ|nr:hypothetical protein [Carboxydothermus hydrogenoformans]ABB14359.1 hypothetical protein CHY_1892 [Carboxydothermus hydrogenoformans Z-2901]